jgi:N-acetylmuramic acid 6-phosphate etherase
MITLLLVAAAGGAAGPSVQEEAGASVGLLRLLGIVPSAESVDYVRNKTQFQLHSLLTEQRHPRTWHLGERVREDTLAGLRMLSSVDEDVRTRIEELAAAPEALERAAAAVEAAILDGRKIYVYGCGATGRLAKQMESTFWRPFWRKVRADGRLWAKAGRAVSPSIEDDLVGEMTGADRALISSLEGFEDLQLIGRLQLRDRGIVKGDVVICVTEGGETSSVIGTVLAALEDWKADPGVRPGGEPQASVLHLQQPGRQAAAVRAQPERAGGAGDHQDQPDDGPQAITGSTRMQATTIETFVVAAVLETAVGRVLGKMPEPEGDGEAGIRSGGGRGGGPAGSGSGASSTACGRRSGALAALTDLEAGRMRAGGSRPISRTGD